MPRAVMTQPEKCTPLPAANADDIDALVDAFSAVVVNRFGASWHKIDKKKFVMPRSSKYVCTCWGRNTAWAASWIGGPWLFTTTARR